MSLNCEALNGLNQNAVPKGWHKISLGEFVTFHRGYDLPHKDMVDGQYPVVGSNGIIGYNDTFKAKGPGVAIGRSGNLGKPFFVNGNYWPHNTSLYVSEFHNSDPSFAYYFLKTLGLSDYNAGSAVPTLNRNHIHSIEVVIPESIEEQKVIGRILSNLDDKIELNQQENKVLEAIGETVFKRWFVDFEFPNQDGKPYKSSGGEMVSTELGEIPEKWKISTIGKLASSVNYGYTQSSSSSPFGPKFLRITDIQGGKIDWVTVPYCEIGQDESKYSLKSGDIVVARTGASTGENVYIEECPKSVFASYLVRIRFADKNLALYVAKFMRTTGYKDYIESCIGGSAQPNANATTLTDIQVTVPHDNILLAFGRIAGTFELAKYRNTQESNTLTMIRDLLLPKLMSGKIRIPINKENMEAQLDA
jgi:type I restriction enzyme S subunit